MATQTTYNSQPEKTFQGRSTWQFFYDNEPSFEVLNLEQADQRLVFSNDAKDDHMRIITPTHTKVFAGLQPCEDAILKGIVQGEDRDYELWAVFDGHGGFATSWKLRREMTPLLEKHIKTSKPEDLVENIKKAFKSFDDDIHAEALKALDLVENQDPNALARIYATTALVKSGSCALVCLYDRKDSKLYTACVGDSRALLLHPESDGSTYTVEVLSVDQNGFNTAETDRIKAEHPDEDPIDTKIPYRVLGGIMVTRAFGDYQYKFPEEAVKKMLSRYHGNKALEMALTPPYLTAEPEVTIASVKKDDILVMGSDGLFDHMSNEGVALCISEWRKNFSVSIPSDTKLPERNEKTTKKEYKVQDDNDWEFDDEFVVAEDDNAATSLIRNSLGGNRRDLFTAVLTTSAPIRREIADDISVHVAFF